jgi:hypothetical protein
VVIVATFGRDPCPDRIPAPSRARIVGWHLEVDRLTRFEPPHLDLGRQVPRVLDEV